MTPLEGERRAREAIVQARAGALGEDTFVELKADWTDVPKLAIKLCAQANSSRFRGFILLVGVQDDGTICGAGPCEVTQWLAELEGRFDQTAPRELWNERINLDEGLVHAFAFDSSAAPYVVRAAEHNRSHERLILVRRGNGTRHAGRADLIAMLNPDPAAPTAELLSCRMQRVSHPVDGLLLVTQIYLACRNEAPVVLPQHRLYARLMLAGVEAPRASTEFFPKPETSARYTRDGVIVQHAAAFNVHTTVRTDAIPDSAAFELQFESAHGTRWRLHVSLPLTTATGQPHPRWQSRDNRWVIPIVGT